MKTEELWEPAPDGHGGFVPPKDIALIMEFMAGHDAPGAMPCETRVVKINTSDKERDRHVDGTFGTIKGSIGTQPGSSGVPFDIGVSHHAYLIEWDGDNGILTGTIDLKLKQIE